MDVDLAATGSAKIGQVLPDHGTEICAGWSTCWLEEAAILTQREFATRPFVECGIRKARAQFFTAVNLERWQLGMPTC